MGLTIPGTVESVEFWKYRPSKLERTRPRTIRHRSFVGALAEALSEDFEKLEYFPESPDSPRFVVLLNLTERKPFAFKVNGNVIVTARGSYYAKKKTLWNLLESKVSKVKEQVVFSSEPHFVRETKRQSN